MTTFATNAMGPLLMAKYFGEHLTKGSGEFGQSPSEGHSGTLVNMSARVGSISDNGEGVPIPSIIVVVVVEGIGSSDEGKEYKPRI